MIQIGQGRAGFYSYRGLENMIGCDITAAVGIDPAFQTLKVGDRISLHPQSPPLTVAVLTEFSALVLVGSESNAVDNAVWSFHLFPSSDNGIRLIERGVYSHGPSVVSRLTFGRFFVEPISFVMSRKMLRTVRSLVEAESGRRS